jgi:hypothetical protein
MLFYYNDFLNKLISVLLRFFQILAQPGRLGGVEFA